MQGGFGLGGGLACFFDLALDGGGRSRRAGGWAEDAPRSGRARRRQSELPQAVAIRAGRVGRTRRVRRATAGRRCRHNARPRGSARPRRDAAAHTRMTDVWKKGLDERSRKHNSRGAAFDSTLGKKPTRLPLRPRSVVPAPLPASAPSHPQARIPNSRLPPTGAISTGKTGAAARPREWRRRAVRRTPRRRGRRCRSARRGSRR